MTLALFLAAALAQQPAPPQRPVATATCHDLQAAGHSVHCGEPAPPSKLSEVDQLRLRVVQLEAQVAERDAQIAAIAAQVRREALNAAVAKHCEAAKIAPEDCQIEQDGSVKKREQPKK